MSTRMIAQPHLTGIARAGFGTPEPLQISTNIYPKMVGKFRLARAQRRLSGGRGISVGRAAPTKVAAFLRDDDTMRSAQLVDESGWFPRGVLPCRWCYLSSVSERDNSDDEPFKFSASIFICKARLGRNQTARKVDRTWSGY